MSTGTLEKACILHDTGRAALACVLARPDEAWPHVSRVPMGAWPDEETRATALAMGRLIERGDPVDLLSVVREGDGAVSGVFVGDLHYACPSGTNAQYYAKALVDAHYEARIRTAGVQGDTAAVESLIAERAALNGHAGGPKPVDLSSWGTESPDPREWVFASTIPAAALAGLDAPGGLGKGFTTQGFVVSLATGRTIFPTLPPAGMGRVLWVQAEDDPAELWRRFVAMRESYDLSDDDVDRFVRNVRLYAGQPMPLVETRDGVVAPTTHYQQMLREIESFRPRLIVLDPRVMLLCVDENSNSEVAAAMGYLRKFTEHGAAVLVVHHVGKSNESEAKSAAGRGASSARDAMRALFNLTPMSAAECGKFGITTPHLFVRLSQTKASYGRQLPGVVYLKRDHNGVLHEMDLSMQQEEIDREIAVRVTAALAEAIGDNPADLSIREILDQRNGAEIRATVKAEFGSRATIPKLREAMDAAIRCGLIAVENITSGKTEKAVPRQRRDGAGRREEMDPAS